MRRVEEGGIWFKLSSLEELDPECDRILRKTVGETEDLTGLVFVSKSSITNFVNLYGNDYPFMKLIYLTLRGGVEPGPEDVLPGRTGAAR